MPRRSTGGEATVKGLVFTTFFAFCEERFGADMLDDVIEEARLPHGGAYTSVGTYPFEEMVALITALVRRTRLTMPAAMEEFGAFCFARWVLKFPHLFADRHLFDILAGIDAFHHSEVKKLYPDAELPSFTVVRRTTDEIVLDYRSCKPLADLAVGVIRGAGTHLNFPVTISYNTIDGAVRFRVARANAQRLAA